MVIGRSGGRATPSTASHSPRRALASPNNNEKTLLLYSRLAPIAASTGNYTTYQRKRKERNPALPEKTKCLSLDEEKNHETHF
jgi:hypothetical protein